MKELARSWGPSVVTVLAAAGVLLMAWQTREMYAAGTPNFQRHEAMDDQRQKSTDARLDRLENSYDKIMEKLDALRDEIKRERLSSPRDR